MKSGNLLALGFILFVNVLVGLVQHDLSRPFSKKEPVHELTEEPAN